MTTPDPGPDPQRGQVRWLLSFARPATRTLALSALARTVQLLLGAVLLVLPASTVGVLLVATHETGGHTDVVAARRTVATVVLTMVGLALVKAGLRYVEQLAGHLAAFGLMAELRVWTLERLVPQAPAVTEGSGSARVTADAHRGVDRVEVFFAHTIAPALTAVLVPTVAVAAAWVMAGGLVALVLALVLALGLLVPAWRATGGRAAAGVAASRADVAQRVADAVRIREEIAVLGAEGRVRDGIARGEDRLGVLLRAEGRAAGARSGATTARVWGGTVLVLAAGLPAVQTDLATLPGLLGAAALVPGTAPALDVVERLASSLPAGLEATRRLRVLAAEPARVGAEPRPEFAEEPAAAAGPVGARLEDVSYTHPGRIDAGVALDLEIGAGRVVGVCGATGSGKSTLVGLLQRRYDVDTGAVRVGGRDVRADGPVHTWRRVVVAEQRPVLLSGTVRENLTLGHDATDEEIAAALHAADLDDMVAGLPDGLDTALGGRGARLSGGQRQRLALARALLRAGQDALLVLDEATSFQDPATQERLVERLGRRRGGTVIVAHRLDVLRGADTILVLEEGHVIERGTWEELTAAQGAFARLLAAGR